MYKGKVLTLFKVVYQHLSGRTRANRERTPNRRCFGQHTNRVPFGVQVGIDLYSYCVYSTGYPRYVQVNIYIQGVYK